MPRMRPRRRCVADTATHVVPQTGHGGAARERHVEAERAHVADDVAVVDRDEEPVHLERLADPAHEARFGLADPERPQVVDDHAVEVVLVHGADLDVVLAQLDRSAHPASVVLDGPRPHPNMRRSTSEVDLQARRWRRRWPPRPSRGCTACRRGGRRGGPARRRRPTAPPGVDPIVPDSPMPFAPSGLYDVGVYVADQLEAGQLGRRHDGVVGEGRRERVAVVVVAELLPQRLGGALGDAAVALALGQQRVDDARRRRRTPPCARSSTLPVSGSTSTTATWAPNGNVGAGRLEVLLDDELGGRRPARPRSCETAGVPTTWKRPASITMSSRVGLERRRPRPPSPARPARRPRRARPRRPAAASASPSCRRRAARGRCRRGRRRPGRARCPAGRPRAWRWRCAAPGRAATSRCSTDGRAVGLHPDRPVLDRGAAAGGDLDVRRHADAEPPVGAVGDGGGPARRGGRRSRPRRARRRARRT